MDVNARVLKLFWQWPIVLTADWRLLSKRLFITFLYSLFSSFPHGQTTMVALVLAIFTFVLVMNSTYTCSYFKIDETLAHYIYPDGRYANGTYGVGYFSYQALDSDGHFYCYTYPKKFVRRFFDKPLKAGYAFAILSNICVGVVLLLVILSTCCRMKVSVFKGLGLCAMMGSLSMVLTFIGFASFITKPPFNGKFGTGAGISIAAMIAAFFLGIVLFFVPEAREEFGGAAPPAPFEPGTITTTETTMPDGGKKILKTTVGPDGSRTVEESKV
jgi:hypothetical protein